MAFSSFLSIAASDRRAQLAATALASAAATAVAVLAMQRLARHERVSRLKRSIPRTDEEHLSQEVSYY